MTRKRLWLCKDVATIIKQLVDPYTYFNLLRTAKVFQPEQLDQRRYQLARLLIFSKALVEQYLVQTEKHPLPVFTRYAMTVKRDLNWQFPRANGRQITKETAKRWHALPEAEKDTFKQAFCHDMKLFNRRKAYIRNWPRLQNKIVERF